MSAPIFPASEDFVIVDFYAEWCEPCKWAMPVISEVLTHFDGKIKLEKIDIDQQPQLAAEFRVMSVPTFILFHQRQEIWRIRGFDIAPTMIRKIEAAILAVNK